MKTHILIQLVYCVWFVRSSENSVDKILDYNFEKDIKGPYNFRFSTSQGHEREEIAELLHEGTEFESIFLRGSYQYLGADGKTYTVKYRADDNGFHPEGDHFEVPPFVPWPSKIDVRYDEDQLKDLRDVVTVKVPKLMSVSPIKIQTTQKPPKFGYHPIGTSTVSSSYPTTPKPFNSLKSFKPDSVNSIKFLTTQRPPKFEYRPIGSSTIPSRYLSTPKPSYSFNKNGRQSKTIKGFNPTDRPEQMIQKLTQVYIPTSTLKPPNKGDVVGSSTARNPKFFSVPLITREYIPTSSSPPELKGDVEGFSSVSENLKNIPQQRRKMSKYLEVTKTMSMVSNIFGRQSKKFPENEINPTIIYEGRPFDKDYSSFEDSSSISIPESKTFGFRTKARKTVRDFVTTEYPSVRGRVKTTTSL